MNSIRNFKEIFHSLIQSPSEILVEFFNVYLIPY